MPKCQFVEMILKDMFFLFLLFHDEQLLYSRSLDLMSVIIFTNLYSCFVS